MFFTTTSLQCINRKSEEFISSGIFESYESSLWMERRRRLMWFPHDFVHALIKRTSSFNIFSSVRLLTSHERRRDNHEGKFQHIRVMRIKSTLKLCFYDLAVSYWWASRELCLCCKRSVKSHEGWRRTLTSSAAEQQISSCSASFELKSNERGREIKNKFVCFFYDLSWTLRKTAAECSWNFTPRHRQGKKVSGMKKVWRAIKGKKCRIFMVMTAGDKKETTEASAASINGWETIWSRSYLWSPILSLIDKKNYVSSFSSTQKSFSKHVAKDIFNRHSVLWSIDWKKRLSSNGSEERFVKCFSIKLEIYLKWNGIRSRKSISCFKRFNWLLMRERVSSRWKVDVN